MKVADLEALLKESKSMLKEFELRVAREREANKELEEGLLIFKKKVVEQDEKGSKKAIRQVGFFAKGLDLGLFDPFKDVKDSVLLNEDDIATKEEADEEEQGTEEKDDVAIVQVAFCLFSSFLHYWDLATQAL